MKNNTQPALKERIEKALDDFTKGRASMHVPPLDTDVDMVLAECSDRLSELEARCAALAAELQSVKAMNDCLSEELRGYESDGAFEGPKMHLLWWQCETPNHDAFLAEVRAQGVKSLSNAVQSVISERQRQQSVEGWTPEHDDQYGESQLLWASSCYVLNTIQPFNRIPMDWPWAPEWWKPTNPRRDLVKAGALIMAEIERIDRQDAAQLRKGGQS